MKLREPFITSTTAGDTVTITDILPNDNTDQFEGYLIIKGNKHTAMWDINGFCRDHEHSFNLVNVAKLKELLSHYQGQD